MARSQTKVDFGKVCDTCRQSEFGIARLRSFGFKVHYCKDCDPDAPPKPKPKSTHMDRCETHEALSVDPDTDLCSLCDHEERTKKRRRRKAAARSKKRRDK